MYMKRKTWLPGILAIISLTSLLLTGCGKVQGVAITPTLAPTSTAVPTNTPLPMATDTPLPTVTTTRTQTPVPKPTVDRTATVEAENQEINSIFGPVLDDYGVNVADGHLAWYDFDPTTLEVTGYMERDDKWLDDAGILTDFVIETKITWNTTGGLALCGITFHAEEDLENGLQNQFFIQRLQFSPTWAIYNRNNGRLQYFLSGNWIPTRDLHDKNDSSNVVALVVKGSEITVFINGDKQRKLEDKKLKEGLVALSTLQESGHTTCKFENTWIWVIDQ